MNNKRRQKRQFRKIVSVIFAGVIFIVCASTAWATLSLVKPKDAAKQIEASTISEIAPQTDLSKKSQAPEPTTMALFGGGLFGMVVRFVRKSYQAAKRGMDIFLAVVGLMLSLPISICAALWIKLTSRGPVFFTQTRVGKEGEPFEIFKFRTMRVDAEKETGPVWASKNDRRLIPGGRFLRKARIDEIPQFINVLRGEMSVVGPRPERPVFVEQFKTVIPDYHKRIAVKPGITGLAQVWHKYDETIEDVKKKVKYDLLYIRKVCLMTDLLIMLRTVRVVLTGQGAK